MGVSIVEKKGLRADPGVEDLGSRRYPFELLDLRRMSLRLLLMLKVIVESVFSVRSLTFFVSQLPVNAIWNPYFGHFPCRLEMTAHHALWCGGTEPESISGVC